MTTISAKIIADSLCAISGSRVTTFELVYPRCIHSEFMTHRVFSRNASSSRAIPVARQIKMIEDDPFVPLVWGKNQKGMQADEECNELLQLGTKALWPDIGTPGRSDGPREAAIYSNREAWMLALNSAISFAKAFNEAGYHKQIVNRLLEPFAHIKVVATVTDLDNFFALRTHKDAEPHIQILANEMLAAFNESVPKILKPEEWHLPYISDNEKVAFTTTTVKRMSAARCARVSYLNFDGNKPSVAEDVALCDKLVGSEPLHASPFEHQVTPDNRKKHQANLRGFRQYRFELENKWQNAP